MRDFYINMLIDAVLMGRTLWLKHYCIGDMQWNSTGIAVATGHRLFSDASQGHSYLVCHWPTTGDEEARELTFQEAKKFIEEHFHERAIEVATERSNDLLGQD
jgi:hypothetical protein